MKNCNLTTNNLLPTLKFVPGKWIDLTLNNLNFFVWGMPTQCLFE